MASTALQILSKAWRLGSVPGCCHRRSLHAHTTLLTRMRPALPPARRGRPGSRAPLDPHPPAAPSRAGRGSARSRCVRHGRGAAGRAPQRESSGRGATRRVPGKLAECRHTLGKLHRKKESVCVGGSRQGGFRAPSLRVPPPTVATRRPVCLTLFFFLVLALAAPLAHLGDKRLVPAARMAAPAPPPDDGAGPELLTEDTLRQLQAAGRPHVLAGAHPGSLPSKWRLVALHQHQPAARQRLHLAAGLATRWPAYSLWRGDSGLRHLMELAGGAQVQVQAGHCSRQGGSRNNREVGRPVCLSGHEIGDRQVSGRHSIPQAFGGRLFRDSQLSSQP